MTTLYGAPGACSLAAHIALEETGARYSFVKVDLKAKRTEAGEDYRAINPKGQVPALKFDSGELLTENAVILQFVADQDPIAGLLPAAGTLGRYHTLEWVNFVATELHKGFGPLFKPDTREAYKPAVRKNLTDKFAFMDARIGHQGFLMGDAYSIADIYAFVMGRWADNMGVDLSNCPHLPDYFARIAARPAVRDALAAEGLGPTPVSPDRAEPKTDNARLSPG